MKRANAWCSKDPDAGIENLEVGFGKPAHATAINIRQSNGPGAIIKLELVDDAGASHTVFDGVGTAKYDQFDFWFRKSFDKTVVGQFEF